MSNTDQELKDAISELLDSWGFEVEQLKEGDEKTPDLLAVYQDERYIIEIKSKRDNEDLLLEEEELLAKGETVKHFETSGYSVPIVRVVEKAVKQIREFPARDSDIRLLWIHAEGMRRELQMEQLHSTLYGTTNIVDLEGSPTRICYYFYNNALHKFRHELDGVILAGRGGGKLCLNSFSPRCASLRQSFLANSVFQGGICDPEELELAGVILTADGLEDRRDSNAVIRFLHEKYGRVSIQKMDMGYFELGVRCSQEP